MGRELDAADYREQVPDSKKASAPVRAPDPDEPESLDIWDAIPVARDADGTVRHITYADMIEDADRDDAFADLVLACKD